MRIHHYSPSRCHTDLFNCPKTPPTPALHPSSDPHRLLIFYCPRGVAFPLMPQTCNTQRVAFSDWLLSLRNMQLRSLRVFSWLQSSSLDSSLLWRELWPEPPQPCLGPLPLLSCQCQGPSCCGCPTSWAVSPGLCPLAEQRRQQRPWHLLCQLL